MRPPLPSVRRLAALLALAGSALGAAAETQAPRGVLRLALPTTLGAPLVDWEEPVARSRGALPALLRLLAERQGLRLEWQALPPGRVRAALQAGDIDMVCGVDAQRSAERELLDWSAPLFDVGELLVGHHGSARLDELADAPADTVIGALQGQPLPALDTRVADGTLRREDALSEDRLTRKLAARRHPYAVLSQPAASQLRAQGQEISPWAVPLDRARLQCGLSRRAPLSVAQWNEALEGVRQSGALAGLSRQGLMPGYAVVVSRANALREVSEQQLVDLYLARRASLPGGTVSRLLMVGGQLRAEVTRLLLGREQGDYAAQWSAQQFGGRRRAPAEFDDPLALRAALKADPQALGVLPLWAVDASLRVLAFR